MARPRKAPGLGSLDAFEVQIAELDAEQPDLEVPSTRVESMNEAVERERKKNVKTYAVADAEVSLPNGVTRSLSESLNLLGHVYVPENNQSIYADPHKYMKHVRPDCMYAWPSIKDPKSTAKLRSKLYRAVEWDEIREDTEIPVEHGEKRKAGLDVVQVGDVFLVEIEPRGVDKFFKNPAAQAISRTARNQSYSQLKSKVQNMSHGTVEVQMESFGE